MVTRSSRGIRLATLRKLFGILFPLPSEWEAFCVDNFGEIHRDFSDRMDRISQASMLLVKVPPEIILDRLRKRIGRDARKKAIIEEHVRHDDTPAIQQQLELQRRLEELYLERELLQQKRKSPAGLNKLIRDCKREQRRTPHLGEGEILAERFHLLHLLGQGGYASVWQAFDRRRNQLVAIKVLHGDRAQNPSCVERFERGARKMQELVHPNVTRVLYEPSEYEGFHFFAMEYLCGGDLHHAVQLGRINRKQALRAILQTGEALECAHRRGFIHRDVKPLNILLDETWQARLTDFDLIWAPDTTGRTRTGTMAGTFGYAAPEAMEDVSRVDHRADIYSLGMTALFVFNQRPLPPGLAFQDREAMIRQIVPLKSAAEVLIRATSLDPEQRHDTVASFCEQLRPCFSGFETETTWTPEPERMLARIGERYRSTTEPPSLTLEGGSWLSTRPRRQASLRHWAERLSGFLFLMAGILMLVISVAVLRFSRAESTPDQPWALPAIEEKDAVEPLEKYMMAAEMYRLGRQKRDQLELLAAEDFFVQAIAIDPLNPSAQGALGEVKYARGHYEEAILPLLKAIARSPRSSEYRELLVRARAATNGGRKIARW